MEMRSAHNVGKPGYFITYWPGQQGSFEGTYLSNAMAANYAHKWKEVQSSGNTSFSLIF
ncbi:hypothetical protein [Cyclobacterium salsum]|uniref:hypothetical protein n=1 Tax=Cyclobacterium salsum TaxID=2666329 RepID=UPI00139102C2|nr:hypothetical protein [Cyclobacterium salsum]